jgi:hypothetical protein
MTLRGEVKNGVVVFQTGFALPDGTLVEVTPLRGVAGKSSAMPAALEATIPVSQEDVAELERANAAGVPAARSDPFAEDTPGGVSKERQDALRQLIGIWKTKHPPDEEEVERIIDQERMKKYGCCACC